MRSANRLLSQACRGFAASLTVFALLLQIMFGARAVPRAAVLATLASAGL